MIDRYIDKCIQIKDRFNCFTSLLPKCRKTQMDIIETEKNIHKKDSKEDIQTAAYIPRYIDRQKQYDMKWKGFLD